MALRQVLPPPFQQPGEGSAGPGLAEQGTRHAWRVTERGVGMLAPGDGGPAEAVRATLKEKAEGQKLKPQGTVPGHTGKFFQ